MTTPKAVPEPKTVRWCSLVETAQGWCLATMTTVGGRQTEQHLGRGVAKAEAEDELRAWVAENLFGWGDE